MPIHNSDKCYYCGGCAGACPKNAITVSEGSLNIDQYICNKCNTCVRACPNGALVKE